MPAVHLLPCRSPYLSSLERPRAMDDLYADMFELAPVSLWLEDYSDLKTLFTQWREEGVTDLRAFLHQHPERVAECSKCLRILRVNQRTLSLYGARDLDELSSSLHLVFRDDMFEQHIEELAQLWACRSSRTERALRTSELEAKGLFEHSPVSLWLEDFTGIKQLIEEVRGQGIADFRVFLDVHPEFVTRCLQEIRVLDINQQTVHMFRAADKTSLLAQTYKVFRDDMRPHFAEQLVDLWNGKLLQQREVVNYALDGEKVHVYLQFSVLPGHEERWDKVLVSLTDISARKKAEAYLEYLGMHDALTGLRNRSFFTDEINRLERHGPWPVSVVVVDLNNLKGVNDEMGHAGGDEFALLLPNTDARGCEKRVEQLCELLALNNQFNAGSSQISLAIGSATNVAGERMEALVHRVDQHMYEAKRRYYVKQGYDRRNH